MPNPAVDPLRPDPPETTQPPAAPTPLPPHIPASTLVAARAVDRYHAERSARALASAWEDKPADP